MYELLAERWPSTLCWAVRGEGEEILIYIPSWRVPQPIPRRIRVRIYENGEGKLHGPPAAEEVAEPELDKRQAIVVRLLRKCTENDRVRFEPKGNPSSWPVGSLALPVGILRDKRIRDLSLAIDWQ
jgi:hypothetical protein